MIWRLRYYSSALLGTCKQSNRYNNSMHASAKSNHHPFSFWQFYIVYIYPLPVESSTIQVLSWQYSQAIDLPNVKKSFAFFQSLPLLLVFYGAIGTDLKADVARSIKVSRANSMLLTISFICATWVCHRSHINIELNVNLCYTFLFYRTGIFLSAVSEQNNFIFYQIDFFLNEKSRKKNFKSLFLSYITYFIFKKKRLGYTERPLFRIPLLGLFALRIILIHVIFFFLKLTNYEQI